MQGVHQSWRKSSRLLILKFGDLKNAQVCKQAYEWRKSNRLVTLQLDDTTNEQVLLSVYGAPHGE